MDGAHFDHLSRLVARSATRRSTLGLAAALGLDPLLAGASRNRCRGGCGPCRVCRKKHGKKTCVTARDGTACDGGACRSGVCTCSPATCTDIGRTCGRLADGCGTTLSCGTCGSGSTPSCHDGTCAACAAACPATCDMCFQQPDGSTVCADNGSTLCVSCTADADCPTSHPICVATYTNRSGNDTHTWVGTSCPGPAAGVRAALIPC